MEQANGAADGIRTVIKQGYLIKCQRGLVKAPKMRYFILTQKGLTFYASKPDESTVNRPLAFLSFKQLTSVKLDEIELNHCTLPCMQITSRTISSFLLAFSQKQERDEWMMAMLTAYSEMLILSRSQLCHLSEGTKTTLNTAVGDSVATAIGNLQGILTANFEGPSMSNKRRKTNHGHSLRRSKSCDDHLNNCTTNIFNIEVDTTESSQAAATSRKRKSMPNVNVISHFPVAWNNNDSALVDKEFRSTCFDHRDSLTLLSSQKQCTKCNAKTSFVSKILSMLEHSSRRMYSSRN